jgi:uncharacterized Ntn-hydrolase superfamily protein
VGSAVPHAEEGIGAVATQATTYIFHGPNSLKLLRKGYEPRKVLQSTLALDPNPEKRQVFIIDKQGRTAAHTGSENTDWRGHTEGENYVAGGNNVAGPETVEAMIRVFEETERESLPVRLLRAVDAGEEAGGCMWPDHTAAILVVGIRPELKLFERPRLDLRVDSSENPTKDLLKHFETYKKYIKERQEMRRRSAS